MAAAGPDQAQPPTSILPGGLIDARAARALQLNDEHPDFSPDDSKLMIAGGLGLGAFATVSIAVFGMACPLCVVAAPVLVGAGIAQRLKWRRKGR